MSDRSCLKASLLIKLKISASGAGGEYTIVALGLDLVSIYSVSTLAMIWSPPSASIGCFNCIALSCLRRICVPFDSSLETRPLRMYFIRLLFCLSSSLRQPIIIRTLCFFLNSTLGKNSLRADSSPIESDLRMNVMAFTILFLMTGTP